MFRITVPIFKALVPVKSNKPCFFTGCGDIFNNVFFFIRYNLSFLAPFSYIRLLEDRQPFLSQMVDIKFKNDGR